MSAPNINSVSTRNTSFGRGGRSLGSSSAQAEELTHPPSTCRHPTRRRRAACPCSLPTCACGKRGRSCYCCRFLRATCAPELRPSARPWRTRTALASGNDHGLHAILRVLARTGLENLPDLLERQHVLARSRFGFGVHVGERLWLPH